MCDVGVSISDVATKRYIASLVPAWAQEPGYKASTQLASYRTGPRSLGTRLVHS